MLKSMAQRKYNVLAARKHLMMMKLSTDISNIILFVRVFMAPVTMMMMMMMMTF